MNDSFGKHCPLPNRRTEGRGRGRGRGRELGVKNKDGVLEKLKIHLCRLSRMTDQYRENTVLKNKSKNTTANIL